VKLNKITVGNVHKLLTSELLQSASLAAAKSHIQCLKLTKPVRNTDLQSSALSAVAVVTGFSSFLQPISFYYFHLCKQNII